MSKRFDSGFYGDQFGHKKPSQENVKTFREAESDDSNENSKKIKDLISTLMENSTSHGVPNIYRAKHPKRRSLWVLLFLGAIGAFLWQVSSLIIKFYNYEVNVLLEVEFQPLINFPAITVCNMNPVRFQALLLAPELRDLIYGNDPDSTSDSTTASPFQANNSETGLSYQTEIYNFTTTTPPRNTEEEEYWDKEEIDYESQELSFALKRTVQDFMAQLPYDDKLLYGHQLETFMVKCIWQGYPCSPRNFTKIYNYMYGNCYTFNSGKDGHILKVGKPGPLYGLSLRLYIEQNEYIGVLQESAGVKVVLHSQDVLPFPEDDGITAAPGMETNIGLKMVEITRKPNPYGNCISEYDNETYKDNIFTNFFKNDYSQKVCEKNCLYNYVIEYCNCSDFRYQFPNEKIPICASNNEEQENCTNMVDILYKNEKLACDCPQKCHEEGYMPVVSNTRWPNDEYWPTLASNLMTKYTGAKYSDLRESILYDDTFIGNNILQLNVYYQELNYEHIKQIPAYDEGSLVSDLGGQLGFWIGLSIITLFEFVEFVIDLLIIAYSNISARFKKPRPHGSRRTTVSPVSSAPLVFSDVHE